MICLRGGLSIGYVKLGDDACPRKGPAGLQRETTDRIWGYLGYTHFEKCFLLIIFFGVLWVGWFGFVFSLEMAG